MDQPRHPAPSRRRVAQAAWAAPAVLATVAAPAASASTPNSTPTPTPKPYYNTPVNDSIVRKGSVVQQLFFYDGDKYFHYTGNAATSKKVTDDNWAMERKTASWHNLVPGRTYTFQITANVGPRGHCPAATVNKTMEIWISNDGGDKWQNVANLRSSDDAVASPRAEVPATTLKYPFPKDYCNNDKNDVIWGEPTTVTFKGTAGPDGVLRFRYNAWMQPQPPGQYPYPWGGGVDWGPAIMRVTHPRIVG